MREVHEMTDAEIDELVSGPDDEWVRVGGLPYPLDRWGRVKIDPDVFRMVRYWQERAYRAENK